MNNRKRIVKKWRKYAPRYWWGDHLDVRFYLVEQLKKVHNKKVLDVGCGPGIILSEVPEDNDKYGIDTNKELTEIARKVDKKANFKVASMYDLPFEDNSFDIVVCANVMPYYDFSVLVEKKDSLQKRMIKEVCRVLKKKGILFVTTPNREYKGYKYKMSKKELFNLLKPHFNFKILGYNPVSPPPRIPIISKPTIPSIVISHILGVRKLLGYLTERGRFISKSKYFYVKAIKK